MDQQDRPAAVAPESPAAWLARVSRNCERINARVARTEGELDQHQRNARDALRVLEKHPCTAYRHEVVAAILETGYELDGGESIPTVDFYELGDMAEFIAEVFAYLTMHDARSVKAIRRAMTIKTQGNLFRVSFGLPVEPEDIPYGAAA